MFAWERKEIFSCCFFYWTCCGTYYYVLEDVIILPDLIHPTLHSIDSISIVSN